MGWDGWTCSVSLGFADDRDGFFSLCSPHLCDGVRDSVRMDTLGMAVAIRGNRTMMLIGLGVEQARAG
jgi:hypothetical protein